MELKQKHQQRYLFFTKPQYNPFLLQKKTTSAEETAKYITYVEYQLGKKDAKIMRQSITS